MIEDIVDESEDIGDFVTFICDATDSDPSVLVQWTEHNGEPITLGTGRTVVGELLGDPRRLQLTIINVGTADAGSYTCTATNPDGASTSLMVMLTVTGKLKC